MTRRLRLGMLTPSSNTALEPATFALLADTSQVTAHFARFAVTEIALDAAALGQFDDAPILRAAELLADAKVDAIAWNGTSASWMGFDRDRALVGRIHAVTGIPATTAVLSLNTLLDRAGIRRFGLVSPYTEDVQRRILANYRDAGFTCAAECHLGIRDNFAFAEVSGEILARLIEEVAGGEAEAAIVLCTNMDATRLAPALETHLGKPVFDSIACALWGTLDLLGVDKRPWHAWGRLFQL